MSEPRWDEAFGPLWAGIVEDIRLSLPLHRVVFTVRVRDGRYVSWYEVTFTSVTRFVFADKDSNPWWTMELTSAGVRQVDGQKQYVLDLTGNDDAVTITCQDSQVTLVEKDDDDPLVA